MSSISNDLTHWMRIENVPGVSIALVEDGKITSVQAHGVTNAETNAPVTPETVFQAASLTKPAFAYAVLRLTQERVIDLDKPLSHYLPESYLPDEPRLSQITARHVLSHMTGFPNWLDDAPLTFMFTPGERWSYSGEGYVYLQKVVEHVTGQSLSDWLRDRLFAPLGMTRSALIWLDAFESDAAVGHDMEGKVIRTPEGEIPRMTAPNAAYSMYTTPSDFAKFMLAMLEKSFLNRLMLAPQVNVSVRAPWAKTDPDDVHETVPDVLWGLGWGLQKHGDEIGFWHWGDNSVFQCFVLGFPQRSAGIVVMSNGEGGRWVYERLITQIYGAEQPALRWLNSIYR